MIKAPSEIDMIKRHIVDSNLARVLAELKNVNAETKELIYRVCGVATLNVIDQFQQHIESQVRLVELSMELKRRNAFMREYPITGEIDTTQFGDDLKKAMTENPFPPDRADFTDPNAKYRKD